MKTLATVGILLVVFSFVHAFETAEHKGNGVVIFGGDSEANVASSDEYSAVVPEAEYKRHNFVESAALFIVGLGLLHHANQQRKELKMKNLSPDQQKLYVKYDKFSTIELYVQKQLFKSPDDNNLMVISALIEERKDRRDYWTLFVAIVAAAASVIDLASKLFGLSQ